MDAFSSRKTAGGLSFTRKASSALVLRDPAENGDRNTQICSQVGCGSRMNSTKGNQIGFSGKAKTTRHPFRLPTSGKEVIGSSSRTPAALSGPRKSFSDLRKKLPSHQVADFEASRLSGETEASEAVIKPDNAQVRLNKLVQNNVSGGSGSIPHSRHGKKTMRSEQGVHDCSTGPSTSLTFKHDNHRVRDGASTSKYKFRNLKCNSINDVGPSGRSTPSTSLASPSSSSELNHDRKRVMGGKRIGEAEGSSSMRGKKVNGPLLDDRRNDTSHCSISISNSRRTRNSTFTRDNDVASVGIQRSIARTGLNEQEDGNRVRQTESLIFTPLLPQPGMPVDTSASSSEYQFPSQGSSNRMNASGRPGSSRARANIYSNRSLAPFDVGFGSSLGNRENVGQYSLDGIAEMLLALNRIDQDEELTYERLLVLETNLFLNGLAFHDQHRDMRLDIDNMTYEELLALEDRMGTVSTALTEEELAKCLKKSIYQAITTEQGTVVGEEGDDIKCSICQEEYKEGNEVGRLGCEHLYHVDCIKQWLRFKNWCPICKASAAAAAASSFPFIFSMNLMKIAWFGICADLMGLFIFHV